MDNALQFSHRLIKSKVSPGDITIDATAGNGHDTLLLARLVGLNGLVISYDIQTIALEKTRFKLEKEGLLNQVKLINRGHETMEQDLSFDQKIRAVTFNLGYLPGGDRSIITRPETTIKALEIALKHLLPGGIITIVTYHGHEGGKTELKALTDYLTGIDQHNFDVLKYQFINQVNDPPVLFAIEKK